jgi:hypothetical protein
MIFRTGGGQSAGSSAAALAQEAQEETARTARRRGRLQAFLAAFCALGVFMGVRMAHTHRGRVVPSLSEQALAGTWELRTVHGDPVGPDVDSVVLSQRIHFQDGRLQGETRLHADTAAATTAMPFPDESVRSVRAGADGHEVTVTWDGSYILRDNRILELHIGNATYRAAVTLDPAAHTLMMDHDAILTFPGPTRYQALSQASLPEQEAARPAPKL